MVLVESDREGRVGREDQGGVAFTPVPGGCREQREVMSTGLHTLVFVVDGSMGGY